MAGEDSVGAVRHEMTQMPMNRRFAVSNGCLENQWSTGLTRGYRRRLWE